MFITLEGVDGSGKTTAIAKIKDALEHRGFEVVFTREPGGEPVAEQIRNLILADRSEGIDGWTEALLYLAARKEHLEKVIIPALKEGKVVISDRFMDSTSAYQGHARGIGINAVDEVQRIVIGKYIPNLTIYFKLDHDEAERRINSRSERKNRLDREPDVFKTKVVEGYEILIRNNPERFRVINANLSIDKVQAQTEAIILEALDKYVKN